MIGLDNGFAPLSGLMTAFFLLAYISENPIETYFIFPYRREILRMLCQYISFIDMSELLGSYNIIALSCKCLKTH